MNEFLSAIPETVKLIGGWATGLLTFMSAYAVYRKNKRTTKQELLEEYKSMYIKQGTELLTALESDSQKRRMLIEMKNFCPECYQKVLEKTGYEADS